MAGRVELRTMKGVERVASGGAFARRSEIAHDRRVEDRPEVDGA